MESVGRAALCGPPFPAALGAESNQKLSLSNEGGRIVGVAAIIAVAANSEGKREIVGLHIGPSEAETFWATFLQAPSGWY
jgi:Transposase, Mutator family